MIISPYFPPSNAADMQRIRTSLSYYEQFGWIPEIVCVHERYSDMNKDPLLIESIPAHIKIHKVRAFAKKMTSKVGLGSIALRALWYYKKYVNNLLKKEHFDAIYFSTTQFPVCILGSYWKKKFKIPYIIDMQDPWHSDYYENKPKNERPKKYWFSYRLNKYLEPIAMKNADGLISVSEAYIKTLKERYPNLVGKPFAVIPFGSHELDFQIAARHIKQPKIKFRSDQVNLVYTGAVGPIMKESIAFLCTVLAGLKMQRPALYQQLHFYFIGTSYAPMGEGTASVIPVAKQYGVEDGITEQTDRIPYFESLMLLTQAAALLIIGSDDQAYNPSKIFTYALAKKPVIGIFKTNSPAVVTLQQHTKGLVVQYELATAQKELEAYLVNLLENEIELTQSKVDFNVAKALTGQQCELFNQIISNERF